METTKEVDQAKKLSEVWQLASGLLSFRIEAPYRLGDSDGTIIPCIAFLPDFGGPGGMVIGFSGGRSYKMDEKLKLAAESRNCFWSCINFHIYEHYNEAEFKEALTDWGYFGDETLRPKWLGVPEKQR